MLPINQSGAKDSSIVAMSQRLVNAMRHSGEEYLMLNRGVNSVVPIDLSKTIPLIDFNAPGIQNYSAMGGKKELKQAINQEYFGGDAKDSNILITAGGISGLDITLQTIDCQEVLLPKFFWGTYKNLLTVRNLAYNSYNNLEELSTKDNLTGKALIICDPGNPLGDKSNDQALLKYIRLISDNGGIVLFDSPYRRLFYDKSDTFYRSLINIERVIVVESFSKSLGLSGQRLGFIHCTDGNFTAEAKLRLQYATNGVNAFAQLLVAKLLNSEPGIKAVSDFKRQTVEQIKLNINYLTKHKLIATELYKESSPMGIFAVIKVDTETLFQHKIGAVGLDYFTLDNPEEYANYSRILVSVEHNKFVSFFNKLKA